MSRHDIAGTYETVVVGGGPAGIFASFFLARAGRSVLLLEAGGNMMDSLCPRVKVRLDGRLVREVERFRMQCPRCTCLTGLGGAAFHFDTNLGYTRSLSRSKVESDGSGGARTYSTLERVLSPFERAETALREVFGMLYELGLDRSELPPEHGEEMKTGEEFFANMDLSVSESITVDTSLEIVGNVLRLFAEEGGEVAFHTRATRVSRRPSSGFLVDTESPDGDRRRFESENVVVATGKLSLPWVQQMISELELAHTPATRIDIGVRLESAADDLAPLTAQCSNPKLSFLNDRGESVRTFCVCAGGRIMQYDFLDAVVLDGQHCVTSPTRRSNFGIVTTAAVPEGMDGTDYALSLARRVSEYGGGRPVACTVDELRSAVPPDDSAEPLDTSLIDFRHGSLRECMPENLVDDILQMVDRLNAVYPGMVSGRSVVAAPVVERVFPQLELSGDMESSEPGLYFAGDSSSKIIGVTYGAATGVAAARAIVSQKTTE